MESICAIIFTIILILPLIVQLQMLIVDPKKLCTLFHYYASTSHNEENQNSVPKLLQYYPKVPISFDAGSDSKIIVINLRTVSSSPTLPPKQSVKENERPIKAILPPTRNSSPFIKTDEVLPVVDITWNYNSYRYKAFEASLRDHYGNNYPPGKVVLNSMQLNLPDSTTKIDRNVSGGLFDFVAESDVALNDFVSRKLEIEYLNPLDHFVTKQLGRPSTAERFTETLREEEDHEASFYNERRGDATIRGAISAQEKNTRTNQRFSREIECVQSARGSSFYCRCNLSFFPRDNYEANNLKSGTRFSSLSSRTKV